VQMRPLRVIILPDHCFLATGPILSKDVQHFNKNTINRLFSYCVFKLAESCTVQYVKVYSTI